MHWICSLYSALDLFSLLLFVYEWLPPFVQSIGQNAVALVVSLPHVPTSCLSLGHPSHREVVLV